MAILPPNLIEKAVEALDHGDVVAMPTETVYGLAGRIDRPQALEKIFRIKERPFFDPLIVHVKSVEQARSLTSAWSPAAEVLARHFWPGPLTLVLPKAPVVNSLITSGLETVGIRCPRHALALELITKAQVPLAAPSANKFGKTSPTEAVHVEQEFLKDQIIVLDGGPSDVGIESTVLKIDILPNDFYVLSILRKGFVTMIEIKALLNQHGFKFQFDAAGDSKASPGTLDHHYMPSLPLIYCVNPTKTPQILMETLAKTGTLEIKYHSLGILKLHSEATMAARQLYSELRTLSKLPVDALVFYPTDEQKSEAWQAILDRIFRASRIRVLT